jgi:NAD(P)-dependent dehydrogenase (short-subunit alcohol dehydrogenase family)
MQTRVSIITGASRGIGLATAQRFARNGFAIVAAARGEAALRDAADTIRAETAPPADVETIAADAGSPAGARQIAAAAMKRFGRIDVLVNNAGAAATNPIPGFDDATFSLLLSANVASVFLMTREVWPIMQRQRGGTIVNISSIASIDSFPGFTVYGACKSWVNAFTKAAAEEGRQHNIRVLAVAPGAVETRMLRDAFPNFPSDQTLDPQDVAAAIDACCDPRLIHATGATLFVRK